MPQKTENAYVVPPAESIYSFNARREIYMDYPSSGKTGSSGTFLIKELAELWLKDVKSILRPSSYARYQSYVYKYIFPFIGEMQACNFNGSTLSETLKLIQAGQGEETPLSQYTIYFVESMVRAMFHYGAENRLVPEILFGKAEYKIRNKKDALPLSELEVQQIVNKVSQQGIDMQIQVMLPLYTGITLSELCGLKWEDVDLEAGRIHIHRNLMRVQQKAEEDGIKKPATTMAESELPENVCRKFIIPEKLNIFLKKISDKRKPAQERYVAEPDKKAIQAEKPVPPDGRTLQNHLKAVGEQVWIPDLTFRTLRDTFAVMCLQAGGDVYSVAYLLGVGTSAVCDRYGQWLVKKDGFLREIG